MLWNFFATFSLHTTKVGSLLEAKVCTRALADDIDTLDPHELRERLRKGQEHR